MDLVNNEQETHSRLQSEDNDALPLLQSCIPHFRSRSQLSVPVGAIDSIGIDSLHLRQDTHKRPHTRREEILTSLRYDEAIDAWQPQRSLRVLREQPQHFHLSLVVSLAHYRIDASTLESEGLVVRPPLLNECESLIEIALIASEQ